MAIETVELTGGAATGLVVDDHHMRAVVELPLSVKLGRKSPTTLPPPRLVRFGSHVDTEKIAPPPAVDWYTKAAQSIARMYLNDQYGDCVIAGKAHALGIWSANDPDSAGGQVVLATDSELYQQYQSVCGPGDNGCYIPAVLDYMRSSGLLAGGKRYTLAGYAAVDWTSREMIQVALDLFGALCIGINLPSAWTQNNIWDVTNSGIVGGHDVTPCGYSVGGTVLGTNSDGVVISSWGRLYLITWRAFTSRQWLEECYVMVPSFLWTGTDKQAPSGVNLSTLMADMALAGGGTVPPMPEPTPPPAPPVPPVPPVPPSPPSPPPPPPPAVFPPYVGQFQPVTVTIPASGLFGRPTTVTIPGQTIVSHPAPTPGLVSEKVRDIVESARKLVADFDAGRLDAVPDDMLKLWHDLGS